MSEINWWAHRWPSEEHSTGRLPVAKYVKKFQINANCDSVFFLFLRLLFNRKSHNIFSFYFSFCPRRYDARWTWEQQRNRRRSKFHFCLSHIFLIRQFDVRWLDALTYRRNNCNVVAAGQHEALHMLLGLSMIDLAGCWDCLLPRWQCEYGMKRTITINRMFEPKLRAFKFTALLSAICWMEKGRKWPSMSPRIRLCAFEVIICNNLCDIRMRATASTTCTSRMWWAICPNECEIRRCECDATRIYVICIQWPPAVTSIRYVVTWIYGSSETGKLFISNKSRTICFHPEPIVVDCSHKP